MSVILSNRMKTPDETILESINRHDYVTHIDANGKEYMLDGGCDYVRCSANGDEEMLTVTSDDSHEVIRRRNKMTTQRPVRYEFIAHPYDCELGASPNTTLSLVIHDKDLSLSDMYEQFEYFLKAAGYHPRTEEE